LATDRQHVDDLARRAQLAMSHRLAGDRGRLAGVRLQLIALDPGRVLDRGYAIVTRAGNIVSSTAQVSPGNTVSVRVVDGTFDATVQG
jgi:exodeoxyribonuclease VII large subunit